MYKHHDQGVRIGTLAHKAGHMSVRGEHSYLTADHKPLTIYSTDQRENRTST